MQAKIGIFARATGGGEAVNRKSFVSLATYWALMCTNYWTCPVKLLIRVKNTTRFGPVASYGSAPFGQSHLPSAQRRRTSDPVEVWDAVR